MIIVILHRAHRAKSSLSYSLPANRRNEAVVSGGSGGVCFVFKTFPIPRGSISGICANRFAFGVSHLLWITTHHDGKRKIFVENINDVLTNSFKCSSSVLESCLFVIASTLRTYSSWYDLHSQGLNGEKTSANHWLTPARNCNLNVSLLALSGGEEKLQILPTRTGGCPACLRWRHGLGWTMEAL